MKKLYTYILENDKDFIDIHTKKIIKINGEETNYMVTTHGEVISLNYNHTGKSHKLKLGLMCKYNKKTGKMSKGYYSVVLCHNGKKYSKPVHVLVAEAFIPNPENKSQVNHINGKTLDNNLNNLEWVTPSENVQHAHITGLSKPAKGIKNGMSKINEETVMNICNLILENKLSVKEIANKVGTTYSVVQKILYKQRWTHITSKYDFSNYSVNHKIRYGVKNGQSKYTEKQIRRVCEIFQSFGGVDRCTLKTGEISKITGVSPQVVRDIKNKRTWKHISTEYNL